MLVKLNVCVIVAANSDVLVVEKISVLLRVLVTLTVRVRSVSLMIGIIVVIVFVVIAVDVEVVSTVELKMFVVL